MHVLAREHTRPLLLAGLFFIVDRVLKLIALSSGTYGNSLLAWEYFENPGIAFGIPIPISFIIILTPIVLVLLLVEAQRRTNTHTWFAWYFVFFGALSNLVDRVVYGFVIDYIRIFTSVINIADVLVVLGVGWYLFSRK